MSDLCMYELEDNVWDEFGESDDHIVPRPGENGDKCPVQGDSRKKARHEVIGVTDKDNDAAKLVMYGQDERLTKKDTMLEKGSWSQFQTSDGLLPSSSDGDFIKEVTGITTNDTRMSGHCLKGDSIGSIGSDFCANGPILADSNSNSYDYPLSHFSQTDNELSFYDNDGEDKESSDLLYYDGWPDIGNFEDVDKMFRSCDSTFGLGSLSNDDEFGWFSSSHANEGHEEALKSDCNFLSPESRVLKNVSEHKELSIPNNTGPSVDDSDIKSVSFCDKASSQTIDANDLAASGHLQLGNESDAKSENDFLPPDKVQMSLQRKQSKHHSHVDGKRKGRCLENGGSLHISSNLKQFDDVKHPFRDSSKPSQIFTSPDVRRHKQSTGSAPLKHTQTHVPYMHLDFSNPSDQISVPTLFDTKSENSSYPSSSSPRGSFHASNQVLPMESSHSPLFKPSAVTNEKRKKIIDPQDAQALFTENFNQADIASPTTVCNRVSVKKQLHQSENEIDGRSEVEDVGIPAELDSSNVQESSCMGSVLDEVSQQATSFRQLQHVMEQLDIRTKLCIRDSLYRLARSAEQRHNYVNPSSGIGSYRDVNGALVAEETNKCAGFMDIETNTNPIDRSIAHLLFHRPPDPSVMPANDAPSPKPHAMVHGSLLSPPMMSEKQIVQETADKKLSKDGEN